LIVFSQADLFGGSNPLFSTWRTLEEKGSALYASSEESLKVRPLFKGEIFVNKFKLWEISSVWVK
jgi:hypothetical protein